ncbi:MAG: hypothetical protein EGS70_05715 [Clostridiales bacterium]|nr:hypothetical protein [Clostridiales bacterium]
MQRYQPTANNPKSSGTEGFQRAIADFVCFHCPLVASAEAKPLQQNKSSGIGKFRQIKGIATAS